MQISITNDAGRMIEYAKAIVLEKSKYYTPAVLESIRKEVREKTSLTTPEEIENEMYRTIYYYWAYGCTTSEYYFLGLGSKTHDEIKEYVLTREKVVYRNHLNRFEDAHILNNKWETYCTFREYFGRDVILLKDDGDFPMFCDFVEKHPSFVVKPTDMGQGQGVHKVTARPGLSEREKRELFCDLLSESEKNRLLYQRGQENSVILEELLVQVPEMARIHPNSVNGVRATTVRIGEDVHLFYPWFKIGRFGQFLTSAVFGTLDACIDPVTGIVNTPGCSERYERFDVHPDTGVPILGFQIPRWQELVETVTELARKLDTIRYVGWDMVLTEKGWVVMEGNFSGDFSWQFCLNRGTKREFEELIGWKLTKDYWWQE